MKSWAVLIFMVAVWYGSGLAQVTANPDSARGREAGLSLQGLPDQRDAETRKKLSLLWTVVSLNMIGADVLGSFIPGAQEEVVDVAGGKHNVQYAMLAGAVVYEIPISMIFLSQYLPYQADRWTNVSLAGLSALFIVGGGSLHPHYLFMASAETLALGYIAWTALRWPRSEEPQARKQDVGLRLDPTGKGAGLKYALHF